MFPYLEPFPGITQPVKRQIPCQNRSFYAKNFCSDYFFRNGNDSGLYNTIFMDFSLPGRVLVKIEDLAFLQHGIFPAGNDASGFGIQTFDHKVDFTTKHIIEDFVLPKREISVIMGFILN